MEAYQQKVAHRVDFAHRNEDRPSQTRNETRNSADKRHEPAPDSLALHAHHRPHRRLLIAPIPSRRVGEHTHDALAFLESCSAHEVI